MVLPWVPETATVVWPSDSAGSILARGQTSMPSSRGADDLGVRLGDGRGDHDDVGPHGVDGGGLVTNVDLDASGLELADVARALEVAARHDDAAFVQDERDAAHARATDADDVDALERKLL